MFPPYFFTILLDILSGVKILCSFVYNFFMDKKLCQNIKSLRKGANLTQKYIATQLRVVESCYANWEQGRTEPNIAMLRKLAELFEVSLDDLINGDL